MASFTPLTTKPTKKDKYAYLYNNASNGGKSSCITGKPVDSDCNVLCNCVGWACGRFNHIYNLITGYGGIKYPNFCCNAEKFIEVAEAYGLTVSNTPKAGAIMCWKKGTLNGSDGAGHVAIVERVDSASQVLTSESGYNNFAFANKTRSNKNGNWGAGSSYTFRGFIYNPAMEKTAVQESTTNIVTTNTQKDVWNALKNKGLSDCAVSGIMGCWQSESSNKACRVEGDYLGSFPGYATVLASAQALHDYCVNVLFPAYVKSDLSISKDGYKGSDGLYYPGIGLAQWTGPRAYNLFEFAKSKGKSVTELSVQIDFFWSHKNEFCSKSGLLAKLNTSASPEEAATIFLDGFEMYDGWHNTTTGKKQDTERKANARSIYNSYATSSSTVASTRDTTKNQLKVISNSLRVRSSPSLNGSILEFAVQNAYYNYYESKTADGYTWYRIGESRWIAYSSKWVELYPVKNTIKTTKTTTSSLKVGDQVTVSSNATIYGKTNKFASWVYKSKFYVRSIHNAKISISITKRGVVTGSVDKKYLTKV